MECKMAVYNNGNHCPTFRCAGWCNRPKNNTFIGMGCMIIDYIQLLAIILNGK